MEYVSFEVEGMSIDSSAPTNNMGYNPDMGRLIDGKTKLVGNPTFKSVDNVMVYPQEDGSIDLILTHTLKEENDIVLVAQLVGKWHYNSISHLQSFSDMLADSIRNPRPITDADIDTTKEIFEANLTKATRKTPPEKEE